MKIKGLIKSPYFLIYFLAVINLLIAFFLVGNALELNGDAPSYLIAMKFIQGDEYDHNMYGWQTDIVLKARILTTPLMLNSSIFLSKIVDSEYGGMLAVNIIFYFLIIYVFYKLVHLIYKNHLVAFFASILFFANYCMINYGITYRTDMGGWFFLLLTILFAVKYFLDSDNNEKFYYLAILSASVGVLFKENGALGLISLGILIMFLPISFVHKVKKVLKTGILFLIIPILYHIFIYLKLHFSYVDWYNYNISQVINNPAAPGIDWGIILLIKVLGWLFLVGWPIFAWGLYQEYKNFDKTRAKILLAILPASLAFLAWPGLTQRIAFVLVPWLAMISAYGLSKIKQKYLIAIILIIYILVGYLTRPFLLNVINL
jgi:hypothetical protein